MTDEEYIRPNEVCRLLHICPKTVYNWNHTGKIKSVTTQGGRYRYSRTEVLSFLQSNIENKEEFRSSFCYCRVSTSSQKEDLQRQIEFFKTQYPNHIIIKDIGSGLNFKRKGLQSLLDFAIKGNIKEVVVTHKDRLCRFGFDLIEQIIYSCSKGKIVVLNQRKSSPQDELVNDLLSIITVFSSRLYGLRSHTVKNKIKETIEESIKDTQGKILTDRRGEEKTPSDDETITLVL